MEVAQTIGAPGYISLYTALIIYGVNFQLTSDIHIMTNSSRKINIGYNIILHKIKDNILLNSKGIILKPNYNIASKERAICDTLYLYPNTYFDNLNNVDWDSLIDIAIIYENKRLVKQINELKNYANKK